MNRRNTTRRTIWTTGGEPVVREDDRDDGDRAGSRRIPDHRPGDASLARSGHRMPCLGKWLWPMSGATDSPKGARERLPQRDHGIGIRLRPRTDTDIETKRRHKAVM